MYVWPIGPVVSGTIYTCGDAPTPSLPSNALSGENVYKRNGAQLAFVLHFRNPTPMEDLAGVRGFLMARPEKDWALHFENWASRIWPESL